MLPLRSTFFVIRLVPFCAFSQPIRTKKYHYALEPKLLPQGAVLDPNDPLLYKTVEPISKWQHSSKNWDPVVSKIIAMMLYDGERETAREVMRKTFAEIKFIQMNKRKKLAGGDENEVEISPIKIINQAVSNCSPPLVLHSVRRGGFIYKVPAPPRGTVESRHIAIRWILESARKKDKNQRIWVSLAHELISAAGNEGMAVGKKKELLKQCEENRAYAFFPRVLNWSNHSRLVGATCVRNNNQRVSNSIQGRIQKIRNVGLIAHIDAGKTTTTERMLFMAGRTRAMGEVDRGDTVTDYLAEERERGISITSAAACLTWHHHDIHIIDTPGHVDFTFEVERGLAAVDSALIIIDACKGVETQTRTVWSQADRYHLPRMIFVNKMDRPLANFGNCLRSLRRRFGGSFLSLQMPVFSNKEQFVGIVDLPAFILKTWPTTPNQDGIRFHQRELFKALASEKIPTQDELAGVSLNTIISLALKARGRLLGFLAELDDDFANEYLPLDNPELLPADVVQDCVKRVTTSSSGFPVLLGSSRRNIGVQPLLDAIVDYLPDPSQRPLPPPVATTLSRVQRSTKCGDQSPPILFTFKILFDLQHGPLSLTRVFLGHVSPGMQIKNWTRQDEDVPLVEKIGALMQLTGDVYEAIDDAGPGDIVALSGLQSTRTGDILGPVVSVRSDSEEYGETEANGGNALVPPPVVHAALEPRSSSTVRNLERALVCMQREDPSFKATFDVETGQWVVAGMGDLHLEVVLSRLRRQYRLDVSMGPLITSHREMPQAGHECRGKSVFTGIVGGRKKTVFVELDAFSDGHMDDSNRARVTFEKGWSLDGQKGGSSGTPQSASGQYKVMAYVRQGCEVAMAMGGPLLRSRVLGVGVRIRRVGQLPSNQPFADDVGEADLTRLQLPAASQSLASFAAILRSAVMKSLTHALAGLPEWKIVEPVMAVEIQVPLDDDCDAKETSLAPFLGELARRRGEVERVEMAEHSDLKGAECRLRAFAPLAELNGFSAAVRSLSSGRAEIALSLAHFRPVSAERQAELLQRSLAFSLSRTDSS